MLATALLCIKVIMWMPLRSTPRQISHMWLDKEIAVPWKESLASAVVDEYDYYIIKVFQRLFYKNMVLHWSCCNFSLMYGYQDKSFLLC